MRRNVAIILFVALALLSIDRVLVRFPFSDRAKLHRFFTEYRPDRQWYPEFPAFLEGVRAQTKTGDSVALIVPAMKWDYGYSYAYYRASYFLAGREVLPLVRLDDAALPQNFERAKYVAAWRRNVTDATRHVVWQGHGGTLLGH
jgi:hypothetical protein